MSWDAVESLDDARRATESLLLPFSRRTWLRLVVITFFVGGVGGGGGAGQAAQGAISSPSPPGSMVGRSVDLPSLPALSPGRVGAFLLVAGAFVLFLGLGYAVARAVMEFVLVDALRTRRVELRRPTTQFLGPGLRLFVFRTVVVSVLLVSAAAPVLLLVSPLALPGTGWRVTLLPLVLVGVGLVWLVGVLVLRLTTDFIVPTMLGEGRTVLSAWRRFASVGSDAWREIALYLVVRFVLGIAAAVVVGLAVALGALVVAAPFALVGGVVALTVGLQGVGLAVSAVLAACVFVLVLLVSVVVQVPVVTYFRYYGLALLGRLDERLDLIRLSADPGSTR